MCATTTNPSMPCHRVAYVHHGSELGGAPVSLAALVNSLKADRDVDACIYCVYPSIQQYFEDQTGVRTESICSPGLILGRVLIGYASLMNPTTLAQTVKDLMLLPRRIYLQHKVFSSLDASTIVHLNSSILFGSAVAARLAGKRIVWHIREMPTGGRYSVRRILAGWLIRHLADQVVTISPAEKLLIGGSTDPKVKVVYNFVKEMPVATSTTEPPPHTQCEVQRDFLAVSLGGISPRKGTAELLEALGHIKNQRIRLTIAGSGHLPSITSSELVETMMGLVFDAEDMLIRLKLKSHRTWRYGARVASLLRRLPPGSVQFVGKLNDVNPLLDSCDVLVFAGTTPHFPRPIYEAWLHRKPVLAFDIAGVSENIDHGQDGILIYPRTGRSLAEALEWLAIHPGDAKLLGEAGHQKALHRFSEQKNVALIKCIYAGLWPAQEGIKG